MPFKMMSPLKRMATTAMKKMKDLSGDGKVTQKDVLIGRGVINPDGTKVKSPNKIMGGMSSTQEEKENKKKKNKKKKGSGNFGF